jgi:SAM-dependent methyltransferase
MIREAGMTVSENPATESTQPAEPADALRHSLHRMWASVAPAWTEHADDVDARGAGVADAMLAAAEVGPGDRVLELACGPGGLGLAAAERVGTAGAVVLSDIAVEMTDTAAARAERLGLTNTTTRVLDLEQIDEPDQSFDVVLCREGLMLVADPARAVGEIGRVLARGGRAAVAVWGPRAENPWLGVLFDAVTAHTGLPVPPPGLPGPFSLDSEGVLEGLLEGSILDDVTVTPVSTPVQVSSFEEWWHLVPSLAGPIAMVLASLPSEVSLAIRSSAESALASFATPAGIELPGVSLVGSGRRP